MKKTTAGEAKTEKIEESETGRRANFIGLIRQEVRKSETINVNSLFLNHLVVLAKLLKAPGFLIKVSSF